MSYTHRLATLEDVGAIAPLMSAFAAERSTVDPSLTIKPNYDFNQYITHQLQKANCFCLVLEHGQSQGNSEIVGFFFFFAYDEAPPPQLPENLRHQYEQESPFLSRRVASALGLYVQPQHRNAQGIQKLILAGMEYVDHWKVSDVDVLISAEQTGIQSLLERLYFSVKLALACFTLSLASLFYSSIPAQATTFANSPPDSNSNSSELMTVTSQPQQPGYNLSLF